MGTPHIKHTIRIRRIKTNPVVALCWLPYVLYLSHHGLGHTHIEIARGYVGLVRCCFV